MDAHEVARILAASVDQDAPQESENGAGNPPVASVPEGWRERLWTVPAETRLGVPEVVEALGRPKSYVYARTGPKAEGVIPHRKLDGALTFTAGELRAWIRDREEEIVGGPMDSTPDERRGRLHAL